MKFKSEKYGEETVKDVPVFSIMFVILMVISIIISSFFAVGAINRTYNVWAAEKTGEAEFAQANQNRRIKVEEARAHLDSAKLLAQAEVERAKGVAEANDIIADGLGGPEGYLRYLYIQQVSNNDNQVIYLPTEAGVPILEAGKR